MTKATKRIPVTPEVKEKLEELTPKWMTYSDRIKLFLVLEERFTDEESLARWFKNHYELFGYTEILKRQRNRSPDFIMKRNEGEEEMVELETKSSNFIIHGHDPEEVDLVICVVKDKELPVETFEIDPTKTHLDRVYVSKKSRKRFDLARKRYSKNELQIFSEAVSKMFDKAGKWKETTPLSDKTMKMIKDVSEGTGKSPDEIVRMSIQTVSTLFDPRLSFGDAIRNIPELAKEVFG